MDIQFLSILITIFFGITGALITFLLLNKSKLKCYQIYPGKLFTEKVSDIKKLEITYNSQKVEGELVFLQLLINNEGNCDIDFKDIYEPLTITYSEPLEVIDAFINDNKFNIKLKINKNSLELNWDLLKKKEYFILNVVIKNPEEGKFKINHRDLLFSYTKIQSRIKNINKIKKESYLKLITNRNKFSVIIFVTMSFIFLLFQTSLTVEFNVRQRVIGNLFELISENRLNAKNLLDNVKERNDDTRMSIENSLKIINDTQSWVKRVIELIHVIRDPNNNINEDEINYTLDEILRMMESYNRPEVDIETPEIYASSENDALSIENLIDLEDRILLQDIDIYVIISFIVALILFFYDLYLIINFIKIMNISRYLKIENSFIFINQV